MKKQELMRKILQAESEYEKHREYTFLYAGLLDFESGKLINPEKVDVRNVSLRDSISHCFAAYPHVIKTLTLGEICLKSYKCKNYEIENLFQIMETATGLKNGIEDLINQFISLINQDKNL